MKRSLTCIVALVSQLCLSSANAGVVLDGTMGSSGALTGPNYIISSDLGKQYGGNLFHSFNTFNLVRGEVALFSGPPTIQNIISRVTGGSASSIDGTLSSSIQGANLYLVNPAGIMFGPNASLDISGSFHASTADNMKLGNTGTFDARTPTSSVLTSAPPSAFGFVSSKPAPISVQGTGSDYAYTTYGLVGLYVAEGKSISLIGGDISVTSGLLDGKTATPWLIASGGRINLASVASSGEVVIESDKLAMNGFTSLGNISLNGYGHISLEPSTGAAGELYIRGNNFYMDRFAIGAFSTNSYDGGIVDIRVDGGLKLTGSSIKATGSQYYQANKIEITNASTISSNGQKNSSFEANSIDITGANSKIESAYGTDNLVTLVGKGGGIQLTANSLTLNGGQIVAYTKGSGDAGDISLTAASLALDNRAFISTQTFGAGDAGNIRADIGKLNIKGGADIDSNTNSLGNGGAIILYASESATLEGYFNDSGTIFKSSIQSGSKSTGHGGTVSLITPALRLENRAGISTQTEGQGNAGSITLDVGTLNVNGDSGIVSDTYGSGNGGLITINANKSIALDGYVMDEDGKFSSSGVQSAALAGSIGNSGSISMTTPNLTMSNQSLVSTQTRSQGDAGTITLAVGTMSLKDISAISSSTYGGGNAGSISISATEGITLDGYKEKENDPGKYYNTGIYSDLNQNSTGSGGQIAIQAPVLTLNDFAYISTAVEWDVEKGTAIGKGNAGTISLDLGSLNVSGGSTIASSTAGPGNAGVITINAKESVNVVGSFRKSNSEYAYSEISCKTSDAGNGGSLLITTPLLQLKDNGRLSVATSMTGKGGDVTLNVDKLTLLGNSSVSSASTGTGAAGNVFIDAVSSLKLEDSAISTATANADGGNIKIDPKLVDLHNSSISAMVKGGTGNGGNIDLSGDHFIIDNSGIIASAEGGNGGTIDIVSNLFLVSPNSIVTASSRLGLQGTVTIKSPLIDVSNGLVDMPTTFLNLDSLVPKQCATREEEISSFVVTHEGIPLGPDQAFLSR